jgi:Pentapeptide repeats (8 copies)
MKPLCLSLLTLALLSASMPPAAAADPAAAQSTATPMCLPAPDATPPEGGAVLRNGNTALILPANTVVEIRTLPCASEVAHPSSISVASPAFHNKTYAAISFEDELTGLTSAWGAVSVNSVAGPLELYPGRADFVPTRVRVWSGMDSDSGSSVDAFLRTFYSCRDCMLIRYGLGRSPNPGDRRGLLNVYPRPNVAFSGDLSGANLYQANLHVVNPVDPPNPVSPTIGPVNLSGTDLSEVEGLERAFMWGANLSGANLIKTDLRGATLGGANLQRAALIDANLSGANLTDADLSGANLNGADLQGAILNGANMNGTITAQASDGQSLATQSRAVQAAFTAAHGDKADARWLAEHQAALGLPPTASR